MLGIFDTHAHYHDGAFDADREILLARLHEGLVVPGTPDLYRVETIVDIAAERDSLPKVMGLVKKYPFIYGTMGLHPDEIADLTPEVEAEIRENLKTPKIVAVGEIGLDYYWNKERREVQIAGFEKQLTIAEEFGLPVVIHSREAAEDTLRIVKEHASLLREDCPGVMHCYAYSVEHAREYASMGFCLGIGGVVTYKNAKKLKEVVREIPLTNLVLETDCPYLTPTPFRGKRNDSGNLIYVAQAVAALKQVSIEEVISVTAENARKMYDIGV